MRIWTFGCSFTRYFWPTWADILIHEIKHKGHTGENWACEGAGNLYIASKIWECHAKNNFGPNDFILVCWSSLVREDRFIDNRWQTLGNVFSLDNKLYQSDPKHFAIRDCTLIISTQLALKQLKVNSLHWSILPFGKMSRDSDDLKLKSINDVLDVFKLQFDLPPMMEYLDLLTTDYNKIDNRLKTFSSNKPISEWHPLPSEHNKYLKECILPKLDFLSNDLSSNTLNFIYKWNKIIENSKKPLDLNSIPWDREIIGW